MKRYIKASEVSKQQFEDEFAALTEAVNELEPEQVTQDIKAMYDQSVKLYREVAQTGKNVGECREWMRGCFELIDAIINPEEPTLEEINKIGEGLDL